MSSAHLLGNCICNVLQSSRQHGTPSGDMMGGDQASEESAHPRKRVCIVGAGAAGMAAAWSLSRFPDRFEVDVIEPGEVCGGVACTLSHEGTSVNYGVQGGSPPSHQNTVEMMKAFGVEVAPTKLDVSFGQGPYNWKNYESKPLQRELGDEIRRFGTVLKWLDRLQFITIFLSIDFVLKLLRFSEAFRHRMVYPLVALFFGTGNQTPAVSSAVIAKVFLDKSLAIFDYDPEHLLRQTPNNIAFDDLQAFYETMRRTMAASERCRFHMRRRATRIERNGRRVRVTLEASPATWRAGSDQQGGKYPVQGGGPRCQGEHAAAEIAKVASDASHASHAASVEVLEFDEIIMATPANVTHSLLGGGGLNVCTHARTRPSMRACARACVRACMRHLLSLRVTTSRVHTYTCTCTCMHALPDAPHARTTCPHHVPTGRAGGWGAAAVLVLGASRAPERQVLQRSHSDAHGRGVHAQAQRGRRARHLLHLRQ